MSVERQPRLFFIGGRKDPVVFLLEMEIGNADLADLMMHLFIYLLLEYLVNTYKKLDT